MSLFCSAVMNYPILSHFRKKRGFLVHIFEGKKSKHYSAGPVKDHCWMVGMKVKMFRAVTSRQEDRLGSQSRNAFLGQGSN